MSTIRFVGCRDFISDNIRRCEYGFWATHVEAQFADGYLGAHFVGGVEVRPIGYDTGKFFRQQFVELSVNEQLFEGFLRSQVGKLYDTLAISSFVTGRDWQAPDSWFCSELIAAALIACGYFSSQLADHVSKITPRDLLLIISGRQNTGG